MPNTNTFTVTTVGGSRQHVVEGVEDNQVASALIEDAYSGQNPGFFLPNPPTFYTLSNVISVSIEGGIPEVIQEIESNLGFAVDEEILELEDED